MTQLVADNLHQFVAAKRRLQRGVARLQVSFMDRRIQIVSSAIDRDFRRAWSTARLARLVNLSPSRLRHLFKAEMSKTPAQYLKCLRMREAEILLRTTFLTVKEIMNRVGISDESHFGHEFKRAYGLAPSKYRSSVTVTPVVGSVFLDQ